MTSVRVPLAASRLVNLSTRASAGAAEATLIPGFVVEGAPAKVLVRAVGPALAAFGLTGMLARPELSLRRADGSVVAVNRGWDTATDAAAVADAAVRSGAFALPAGGADCAILATLLPGAYTAPVTSVDGGAGVALVEAYAVERGSAARLRNLSARALVGSGAAVAIPGMVIEGTNARSMLVRVVGPGLAAFGIRDVLTRPSLVLMSGSQPMAANAGWEMSADPKALVAAAIKAGAFPLGTGQNDAALIATLPSGVWTIQVAGLDGGAGVVLMSNIWIRR